MRRGIGLAFLVALITVPASAQTTIQTDGDVQAQGFVGDGSLVTQVDAETLDQLDSLDFAGRSDLDALDSRVAGLEGRDHLMAGGIVGCVYDLADPHAACTDSDYVVLPAHPFEFDISELVPSDVEDVVVVASGFKFEISSGDPATVTFLGSVQLLWEVLESPLRVKFHVWDQAFNPCDYADTINWEGKYLRLSFVAASP